MKKLALYDRVAVVSNGWSSEIVVGKDQQLYLTYDRNEHQIPLGPATKARVEQILFNLNQIKSVLP